MIAKSLHTLLHTVVDYAGLFPPAALPMDAAAANYARYRASAHAWMLGRFVVPVARLDELLAAMRAIQAPADGHPWRLSALVSEDHAGDLARVAAFNRGAHGAATVDSLEVRAASVDDIRRLAHVAPREMKTWVEVPVANDPQELVNAIAAAKLRAKIRTGGVTPDAFPSLEELGRFILACYAAGAAFKATAGLHHALRAPHALTYQPGSPRAVMHGFLNVFLTAAFHYNGMTRRDALDILSAESLDGVTMDDDRLSWRDYVVTQAELSAVRRRLAVAFGSCSFQEPVDELISMGLLT